MHYNVLQIRRNMKCNHKHVSKHIGLLERRFRGNALLARGSIRVQIKQKGVYYKKKELTNHRIDSFFLTKKDAFRRLFCI